MKLNTEYYEFGCAFTTVSMVNYLNSVLCWKMEGSYINKNSRKLFGMKIWLWNCELWECIVRCLPPGVFLSDAFGLGLLRWSDVYKSSTCAHVRKKLFDFNIILFIQLSILNFICNMPKYLHKWHWKLFHSLRNIGV